MFQVLKTFLLLILFTFSFSTKTDLPNVKLKNMNKENVKMVDLTKDGPIVINFWNLACEPCKKEMKFLNQFHKKYREDNFQVFSINMDTPRSMSKVKSFIKTTGYEFTVLSDPRSESFRKLGGKAMPLLLLVNKDGSIFKRHTGYNPGDEIALEEEIKELILNNNSQSHMIENEQKSN
ncbi:MAG: TlpA disulfide reductase family protein [Candidatus Neomarinimicrobiota bacterium]|nr:TlpA disulfide reductase family protein [Candidatus Neomarinimicrobiota bacterium]